MVSNKQEKSAILVLQIVIRASAQPYVEINLVEMDLFNQGRSVMPALAMDNLAHPNME
jgi:hypothetical protein